MKKTITILFLILTTLLFSEKIKGQENQSDCLENDSLKTFFLKMASSRNDIEKKTFNKKAIEIIEKILKDEKLGLLDSVPHLGKLTSDDKKLKIVNWNLVYEDGTFEYFAYILYMKKGSESYTIFPLNDKSKQITDAEEATLTAQNWMGALYYQIIEKKKFGTKYYILLGWDGFNEMKNRKVIEVLHFPKNKDPKFGAPIFGKEKFEAKRRIIFEYANRASMTLTYNPKVGMIVYDHLAPSNPSFKDQLQYYGPDGSYDGFKYKRGKWTFVENIDVKNPKDHNKKKKKRSDNF